MSEPNSTPNPASAQPVQQPHRNNLNFLRVVLAALVILSHAPEITDGNRHREILTRLFHALSFGELAVDGFFILSGYLIVQSWLRSASAWDYLKKRVLRIYPGFIVASLFSVFVVGSLGASDPALYLARMSFLALIKNLLLLSMPQTPATFVGLAYPFVNGALWTILYEFGCYLLVMALGAMGLLRRQAVMVALFVLAMLLNAYVIRHGLPNYSPGGVFGDVTIWPRFLTFFLAGSCCYVCRERIAYRPQWAWLALALLVFALWKNRGILAVLPVCGTYLLLYAGLRPVEPLSRVGAKVDLSYGLYLYAWPIQTLLVWYYRSINPWLMFVLALGMSAGLAWLSWRFVEKPALTLKRRAASP